jgi:lipid-binding SYLF domain-containing protein
MKMMRSLFIAATTTLLFCMSISTAMAKDEAKKIGSAVRAMKEISAIKKNGIPPALLNSANAIAIIPGAAKTDFMVSGKSAGGVLMVHDKDGKWSNPLFISLSGGTLGWQIVGGPMDIILIFKNKERADAIMKDKLHMDVKVKVVAGPLGKAVKAATKEDKKVEISSYVRSHGEFFDVTVASSTVQIENAANDDFYGKPKVSAGDIVSGKVEKASDDVKNLQKLLTEYAARK